MTKKVAVVLAGCGYLDGAEIRESVLTLLALDKHGKNFDVSIYAPDIDQYHVVNHLTAEVDQGEKRNVLKEAARIARGKIQALSQLNASEVDALIMPGGFGCAKNLSDFAFNGTEGKMLPELQSILETVHKNQKPIGAICISPAVISLLFGKDGVELTIGTDEGTAGAITALGGKHKNTQAHEIVVDEKHKIVSTAAYMFDDAPITDIATGIEKCVQRVLAFEDHDR